jgi:glycosyltransferase involved in cell wall biosynthesis
MRILFVADGRSPIALNWIAGFVDRGHEIHLASTFACNPGLRLASLAIVPAAFSGLKAKDTATGSQGGRKGFLWGASTLKLRTSLRQWLGPLTLPRSARRLREVIDRVRPDIIHAIRIPYEGMIAALAEPAAPLLVSVWGNDFTLHAPANALMGRYTTLTLNRAQALHTDCYRDVHLAHSWGFPLGRPSIVLPGGGGIQMDVFYPGEKGQSLEAGGLRFPVVINPRGFRAYVRNDTFFKAIPIVLKQYPHARFLCPSMAGEPQAQGWTEELGLSGKVELLPQQTRPQMADLFRQAQVAVSPTFHDGTPNTVLEAMACGSFPVVGDIESLREWITPGVNGLLVDPADPQALAEAVLVALDQPELRQRAATRNVQLIAERAEYGRVMQEAEAFYQKVVLST